MARQNSAAPTSEIVVKCVDLDTAMSYFVDTLGFRLEAIFPADAPRTAVVSGADNRIRLEMGSTGTSVTLRVHGRPVDATPPPGIAVEFIQDGGELHIPDLVPTLTVQTADSGDWVTGRAGMQYRDLLPDRLGGRFIASHIRIPTGGPVPDYVHHHAIRFQMIYCYQGWVRLVYEDQGEPFIMRAGDCVLQPPHIRHRVLECSDAFEVVEIGCPAEHETLVDHAMALPTPELRPRRDFHGQRFVFHEAAKSTWEPWRRGFEARDTGIGAATQGLAGAAAVRACGESDGALIAHDAELVFWFVLAGHARLRLADGDSAAARVELLGAGDAVTIPAGVPHTLLPESGDFQILEVSLPAEYRAN